jgi:hypothetical protein
MLWGVVTIRVPPDNPSLVYSGMVEFILPIYIF